MSNAKGTMKGTRASRSATNAREARAAQDGDRCAPARAERLLILGATPLTEAITHELARRNDGHTTVVGIVTSGETASHVHDPVLGPVERLDKIIRETRPNRIVVDLSGCVLADVERRGSATLSSLLDSQAVGVVVEDAVDAYERLVGKAALEWMLPRHVIFSKGLGGSHGHALFTRALSLVAASIGLVVLAPLFLVLAIGIKLDSGGPVFFVNERLGRGGRMFKLLKFRTMRPAPDDDEPSEWRTDRENDERVTRIGRWLSRFRLDELPQLVNVLRGEMELVGPRPHPVRNAARFNFKERIEFYSLRLLVRPGITGWAQTQYKYARNVEEEREKMRYDLYYVKHRSVALDLRILALTLKEVVLGRGFRRAGASGNVAISAGRREGDAPRPVEHVEGSGEAAIREAA